MEHVLVIDDYSSFARESIQMLRDKYGFGVIYNEKKKKYSEMVNQAALTFKAHRYTHMVTLNNDVEVIKPFAQTARENFNIHPRVGIVGGLLFYPNSEVQSAGFEVHSDGHEFTIDEYDKYRWGIVEGGPHLKGRFVQGVTGAMQFIDISKLISIGGYNTDYDFGFEDVEFCLRMWLKGGWTFYSPRIQAVHCESATRGRFPSKRELASYHVFQRDVAKVDFSVIKDRMNLATQTLEERYKKHV